MPGKDRPVAELTTTIVRVSTAVLMGKSLSQLIYLILNPVLLTHLVIEQLTDPSTETRYQFLPPINLCGFTMLEDLEIYDRCTYNIHTGERQPSTPTL